MSSISTPRLVLDLVTMSDCAFLETLFSHSDVRKYYVLMDEHARDISRFASYMVKAIQEQSSMQYIIRLQNGTPIGLAGGELNRESSGVIAWNVSYAILPAYRNRGYATEAVTYFTQLISKFNIPKAFLDICDDNEASKRVAQKTGYAFNKDTCHFDAEHFPDMTLLFHWEKKFRSARDQFFSMGVRAFQASDYRAAASLFAKALEEPYEQGSQQTDALCYSNMGVSNSHAGNYQQAYICLKKAQSLGLNNATIQKELLWLKNNRGIG